MDFDIDAGGQSERVSWTEPDSQVAFLALDRNGNGTIDNGSELFGTATPLSDGSTAPNGFIALADIDQMGGVPDGRIDSRDSIFPSLRLWLDRNHNGRAESSELLPLADSTVTTVFTAYRESRRVDRNGNRYAYLGRALVEKNGRDHPRVVSDVILAVQR